MTICKLPGGWQVPAGVKLAFTERSGGLSAAPYHSLNLGLHVGDDSATVLQNRALLGRELLLPAEPAWLNQVHGTRVLHLETEYPSAAVSDDQNLTTAPDADASYTAAAAKVCVVMTADCLPVLFASKAGDEVAAAHAGWRGLCDGVLEATLSQFRAKPADIIAYLGPAIGPEAFEVGAEVRDAFLAKAPAADLAAFDACFAARDHLAHKYFANLFELARLRLKAAGVQLIFADESCTFSHPERFFSYRRERVTGRMASLIWRE
ncbi:peptidoglycan editing factor PgeF [Shewanella sp. JM162201]|uniref:Purine nucleoside phosphorylase n=1 Tax=Shewanella jiangmenensis TaxID=2837387 RepID=A0ABS5V455_9GAMM|nr:peptidoglycan editing factor PgeF [Shewanella jiangmenensis]MBT1444617.1 peptidoglycan editing factor PgeF [Shewanella jiangmenensis]